jgi:2-keto-4-pentenoate hydratase
MKPEAAKAAAAYLADAWRIGYTLPELPSECRPRTMADGMQIQDAVVAELDFPLGGWKVGCTSRHAQRYLKITQPIAGRVFATRMFDSGVALPCGLRGIEGEFAFVLGRDLPPRGKPYTQAELRAAVAALRPAIEVIDPRFTDWLKVNAASIVADMAGQAALVLGPPVRRWRMLDLRKLRVRISVGGQIVGEGTGAEALGDPLRVLAWLANHLRARGGLKRGEIVSTGTCTGFHAAPAASEVVADFGKLGEVRLTFA